MDAVKECRCLFRHPQNDIEREFVRKNLLDAVLQKDRPGMIVADQQLNGHCAARDGEQA